MLPCTKQHSFLSLFCFLFLKKRKEKKTCIAKYSRDFASLTLHTKHANDDNFYNTYSHPLRGKSYSLFQTWRDFPSAVLSILQSVTRPPLAPNSSRRRTSFKCFGSPLTKSRELRGPSCLRRERAFIRWHHKKKKTERRLRTRPAARFIAAFIDYRIQSLDTEF